MELIFAALLFIVGGIMVVVSSGQIIASKETAILDDMDAVMRLAADMQKDNQALRDRLAATLWELRRAKRAMSIDDQFAWRLGELERKLATWEGD